MRRAVVLAAAATGGLMVVVSAGPLARVLNADERAAKQAVKELLEVGWGDSFRALEPAAEQYANAKAAAPRDPRVPHAFALVHLKHGKHSDAAKLLDEVLALDRRHLPAREAKVWIEMLLKRYPAAMVEMGNLSEMLPTKEEPGLTDELKTRHRETARYLGRLCGFLEGPAEKAANADRVAEMKKAMLERLSAEHREEFEAGRKAVADRFAEFFVKREQVKEDTVAEQKKTQAETAKRLAEDKTAIAADKEAIAKQAAQTREQVEKLLSDIERKAAPLDKDYSQLAAKGVAVRERILDLDRDIDRLFQLAATTEDEVTAARYRLEAERVRDVKSRHVADYRVLEGQAARVRAQLAALLGERDAVLARYNAEARRLGNEQIKLAQTAKRIAREEDRNRKAPTGNSDKVHALSQKVFAFTTYEPFPLEQSKSRLLESLR
jgi:hypothetical protein